MTGMFQLVIDFGPHGPGGRQAAYMATEDEALDAAARGAFTSAGERTGQALPFTLRSPHGRTVARGIVGGDVERVEWLCERCEDHGRACACHAVLAETRVVLDSIPDHPGCWEPGCGEVRIVAERRWPSGARVAYCSLHAAPHVYAWGVADGGEE